MVEIKSVFNELLGHKEAEPKTVPIYTIALTGMADLPPAANTALKTVMGIDQIIDSKWFDTNDTLDKKLARINVAVKKARNRGEKVIIVGISAGALLSKAYYESDYEEKFDWLISLSGLLEPDPVKFDENGEPFPNEMDKFRETSLNIREVLKFTKNHTTPKTLNELQNKTSSFSSYEDTLVPVDISKPDWILPENQHFVSGDHTPSIMEASLKKVRSEIKKIAQKLSRQA